MCNVVRYHNTTNPPDHSKRFTLHPLADLFIPRSTWFLWKEFNHTAFTAHKNIFRALSGTYLYTAQLSEMALHE